MRRNPARGPEDVFDPDNMEIAAFMADYGHNFKKHSSISSSNTSGSSRWSFSLNKLTIAIAIALGSGLISWVVIFICIILELIL